MIELTQEQVMNVSGGKFKFHINIFQTVFTAVGAFIIAGPVAAGMVVGAAIAAQGAGSLHEMYVDEYGNKQHR